MRRFTGTFVVLALLFQGAGPALYGQTAEQPSEDRVLCQAAAQKAKAYDFASAIDLYKKAVKACQDTLFIPQIQDRMRLCENGLNMSQYVCKPKVVAKQKFSLDDFFLYYPLPDRSWRSLPNSLDSLSSGSLSKAMFVPEGSDELIFSMTDSLAVRSIVQTHRTDSLWSHPAPLGGGLASTDNEIYPMRCGNKLYFSSRGYYGMGGYDLYVSELDTATGEWGAPENLGFPYSSPYDDFLFMNTDDDRYSIFASNRECSADSVYIYVLEYEQLPVRSAVTDPGDLREISSLNPSYGSKKIDNHSAMGAGQNSDPRTATYMKKMSEVRALRDSISLVGTEVEAMRQKYAAAPQAEKESMAARIKEKEQLIPVMNERLLSENRQLQAIEMEFLRSGVVISMEAAVEESDKEIVGVESSYTFSRKNPGKNITSRDYRFEP